MILYVSRMRRVVTLTVAGSLVLAQAVAHGQFGPPKGGPHVSAALASLTIAAAADLQTVLPELVRRFEKETGTKTTISFGSSGNFFAQIRNGAPFDIFFSADLDYPTRLIAAGLADGDSLYRYGTGRIVVWTRKDAGVSIERGLASLSDPRVRRVAIANPEHAPYGRAAVAALKHEGVYEGIHGKLVFGENISQTAQLVESGNADVGILALSLALGPALTASGIYVEIPATSHPPIDQGAVVVSASRNKPAAHALLVFVRRADVVELLRRFGFGQ